MNESITTTEVYITGVTNKQGKNGPYALYETAVSGTLVCFVGDLLAKIVPSDTIIYHLVLADAKAGFKYKSIRALIKTENKPRMVPPPAPTPAPAVVARPTYDRPYTDKTDAFEAKDLRISRLSIFSSLVNLAAAKASGDAEFAKQPFDDLILDIVDRANMVTREFIYGSTKTEMTSNLPATTQVTIPPTPASTPEQHGTQAAVTYSVPPAQTVTVSPPTTVAKVTVPPATPSAPVSPVAPVTYVPPTGVPPTETKTAATTSLFGNAPDLEQRMAARLKELTSRAHK